jgi:phosphatidate cytidylyltransferase
MLSIIILRKDSLIGESLFIFLLGTTKLTDSGAYIIGSLLGRHKLAPTISPKKTIEGAIGGLIFGMTTGTILWYITPLKVHIPPILIIIMGVFISLFSQIGDLLESYLKRFCSKKDSSGIFGAEGGALDLIDSLILSGPVACLLWFIYKSYFLQPS